MKNHLKISIIGFLIIFLGLSQKSLSQQNDYNRTSSFNNSYWKITAFKCSKKIKKIFLQDQGVKTIKGEGQTLLFMSDSVVFLSSVDKSDTLTVMFKFKSIALDSIEFFGSDRYISPEKRITYKFPSLRKFEHYTFSYKFKVKQINPNEIVFYRRNPKIKFRIKYFKEYLPPKTK